MKYTNSAGRFEKRLSTNMAFRIQKSSQTTYGFANFFSAWLLTEFYDMEIL